jgi:hypothetical protein
MPPNPVGVVSMRDGQNSHRQHLQAGIVVVQVLTAMCSFVFACFLASQSLPGGFQFLIFSGVMFVWSAVVATNDKVRLADAFAFLDCCVKAWRNVKNSGKS